MFRNLTKTLTAGALAATLAVTGITATATPALANGHRNNNGAEAAAIFGGLLLLYGLSQAGRSNASRIHTAPPQAHPRPQPQPRHQRVIASHCYAEGYNHNNRLLRGYRVRCMQNNVSAPHLLPQNCIRQIWTDRGQRRIYGNRCLANNGWVRPHG